jgi:flagellar biosynthesis/type III secretory pathway chaperone
MSVAEITQELLQAQVNASTALLETLQQEYAVLKERNTDELIKLADVKQKHVDELDALNGKWLDMLHDANVKISISAIHDKMQELDPDNKRGLVELWEVLSQTARECHRQNTINGTTMIIRQQATQATIEILRGQMPGESLYGPQGQKESSATDGKSIAKA